MGYLGIDLLEQDQEPGALGADVMNRLGISEAEWQSPSFSLLRRLGFSKNQAGSPGASARRPM